MSRIRYIFLCGVVALVFITTHCKADSQNKTNMPSITMSATIQNENTLLLKVHVPVNHHAYLNSGKEDNLIPVTAMFNRWSDPALTSHLPVLLHSPTGTPDNATGALVLRDTGEFVYKITNPDKLKGMQLDVRSQICNETNGICYRPEITKVVIE